MYEFGVYVLIAEKLLLLYHLQGADPRKLHFPLYEEEAETIIPYSEPSPFGRANKTAMDTACMRNSLQLNPQKFEVSLKCIYIDFELK